MKKIAFLSVLAFLFIHSYEIKAQKLSQTEQRKVNEAFKKGTVVYFKFQVTSQQELPPLSKIISIERTQGKTVFAKANKAQFSKFIVKGYPYTITKTLNPRAKPKSTNVKK